MCLGVADCRRRGHASEDVGGPPATRKLEIDFAGIPSKAACEGGGVEGGWRERLAERAHGVERDSLRQLHVGSDRVDAAPPFPAAR
jgi:hypothetical protein